MTEKPIRRIDANKFSSARAARPLPRKLSRRPFWLPASNYYVLTAAGSTDVFFFIWVVLHDGGEEMPWIWAGIAASFVLGGAVAVREVVLRKARARYLLTERRLDANLKNFPARSAASIHDSNAAAKLSIEQNAAIIKEIQQKSDATKVLGKFSDAHREVFEMCDEYLALNRRQLETVGVGSPRLAALRRGREIVEPMHEFHLLAWAQNESRSLTQESKIRVTMSEKLEAAQRALSVLDSALSYYPDNPRLVESESAVREFAATIKVSHWVEQAERSAFKGNYKRAINHYRDALFFMAREDGGAQSEERRLIAERIGGEIERLRTLSSAKKLGENN